MQKWEYLIVETHPSISVFPAVLGRVKSKGLFSGSEQLDPVADHYNKKIKSIAKEQEEGARLKDLLNLLGNDGWELTTAVSGSSLEGTGSAYLFLKRPVVVQE